MFFSKLSIKGKIRFILTLISVSGLVIASAAFMYHNLQTIKKDTLQHIRTLTHVIEKDISVALAFNDADAAKDTLSALKVHEDVLNICIFDSQQQVFASYSRYESNAYECVYLEKTSAYMWQGKFIDVVKSIDFDGEKYGTLIVHYSLDTILDQFKLEFLIAIVILLASVFFVSFLSLRLEKFITTPILDLKKTADQISEQKDHSLRAVQKYPDEVGNLVDGFNKMLDEIESRDAELERQNELLETRVSERTLLLQKRKEELEQTNFKLETAVEEAEKMTRAAEKANQYKSEFLASMSHEIRTPMNAILGFTDLLKETLVSEKDTEYLKAISNAGKTLLKLINEILDLAKIEAGKLELKYTSVDLVTLIHEVRQIFSKSFKDKGLDFLIRIDPGLPQFMIIDGIRLRQVLFNLIGNAVKFTEKGKIELSVEGQPDNNSKQLNLTLEIKDTGIGIDPDQQKRIFEAFGQHKHQDSSQYGGTGLGLTISKRLVAMMNGSISLESEPGKGSCFTVLLNDIEIDETQNKDIMIMAKSESTVEFDPSTLLVVDDHDTNRTLIKEYLKSTNLKVIEACNGKEAIDVIRKSNIDLVLMDLKMPVMDGYETIEIIKKDEDICHLPVIAASATIMAHNEAAVFEAGFDKFLKKPVSKADLIDSLANYLPHKKIDVPRQEEEKSKDESYRFKAKNLTPEVKSKLPMFFDLYETSLSARLNEISEIMLISDISKFAEDIQEIAETYRLDFLIDWSQDCIKYIDHFDVENLSKSIDALPGLIDELKKREQE